MQVFTSDHALKLDWIPNWIAIIGSGYIGLEFSDVYTALGSEVTFIEVLLPAALAILLITTCHCQTMSYTYTVLKHTHCCCACTNGMLDGYKIPPLVPVSLVRLVGFFGKYGS